MKKAFGQILKSPTSLAITGFAGFLILYHQPFGLGPTQASAITMNILT